MHFRELVGGFSFSLLSKLLPKKTTTNRNVRFSLVGENGGRGREVSVVGLVIFTLFLSFFLSFFLPRMS
jgi:hypothetical protein